VEPSITNSKTRKLPSISVWVSTALDGGGNQAVFEQLFIKETSMSAQIANQVANFGSDAIVFVLDKDLQFVVNIGLMNVFIELLGNTS